MASWWSVVPSTILKPARAKGNVGMWRAHGPDTSSQGITDVQLGEAAAPHLFLQRRTRNRKTKNLAKVQSLDLDLSSCLSRPVGFRILSIRRLNIEFKITASTYRQGCSSRTVGLLTDRLEVDLST